MTEPTVQQGSFTIPAFNSDKTLKPNIASEIPISIPRSRIHPWADQPRQYFSEASVLQLADSFVTHGFKGTLVVRPHPEIAGDYQLIAGERRYLAAELAGLQNILCFIGDFSDENALDFSLCENLNREDLSTLEKTLGILNLIEARFGILPADAINIVNTKGHSDKTAGRGPGVRQSKKTVSHELEAIISVLQQFGIELQTFRTAHLPTLKLPAILKTAHLKEGLSYLSARALAQITDEAVLKPLLKEVLTQKLSVRKVRARVKEALRANPKEPINGVEKVTPDQGMGTELGKLKVVIEQLFKSKSDIEKDAVKVETMKRLIKELKELLQ